MKRFKKLILFAFSFSLLAAPLSAFAMSAEEREEFDRIGMLDIAALTEEAAGLLDEKYPDEDWEAYDFPSYVFTNEAVEIGYMIAVKEPKTLTINTCYCFCDAMGHRSLLNCFLKEKKPLFGSRYDAHGSNCNICYRQAMMALLWTELGATEEEILAGMEKKFERLIKLKEEGKLPPPR